MLLVICLELIAFLHTRISSHRRNIDHAVPEFDEGAPHYRKLQIRYVSQTELRQPLVFLFAQPADEGGTSKRDAHAVGCQPVLGEAEVEEGCDGDAGASELFLLFRQVGAANEAYDDFMAEFGKELEHFWRGSLGAEL